MIRVLIVTHGRAALLHRALQSVVDAANIANLVPEIVVIVNGGDVESSRVLEKFPTVRHEVIDCAVSPAEARNIGLQNIKAKWVFFLDDDAFIPLEYFQRWLKLVEEHGDVGIWGGPNYTPPSSGNFQRITGAVLGSPFATYRSRARYSESLFADGESDERALILCNLWVQRDALAILGVSPFEGWLKCGEENYLLQRLQTLGVKAQRSSQLWLWHERRSNLFNLSRQVYKYGLGRAQNTKLNPASVHWAHLVPPVSLVLAPFLFILGLRSCSVTFFLPFVCYAALLIFNAWRLSLRLDLRIKALPVFVGIHVSYALGFCLGLLLKRPKQEGKLAQDSASLEFSFYGVRLQIFDDGSSVVAGCLKSLAADFQYFVKASVPVGGCPVLRLRLRSSACPKERLPKGRSIFRTRMAKAYGWGSRRTVVYNDTSVAFLVAHGARVREVEVFSPEGDFLYEIAFFVIMSQVGELLDLCRFHRVHALGFEKDSKVHLYVGAEGVGKSTFAAKMRAREYGRVRFFSDESPLLFGNRVYPFPFRMSVRQDAFSLLSADELRFFHGRASRKVPHKSFPEKLGYDFGADEIALPGLVDEVMFLERDGGKIYLRDVRSSVALKLRFIATVVFGSGVMQMREYFLRFDVPHLLRLGRIALSRLGVAVRILRF